jgi:pimeloyl-ACP methyl ester carboxylesterase
VPESSSKAIAAAPSRSGITGAATRRAIAQTSRPLPRSLADTGPFLPSRTTLPRLAALIQESPSDGNPEPAAAVAVSGRFLLSRPLREGGARLDTAPVTPEVRYARSGDVSIAYQVVGDGPFDLVWTPGALSHLDLMWEDEAKARFHRTLASFSRLITFGKRGTGLSDRVAGIADLETRMDDIRAVMDAAGSESAAVCGVSEGGPMALLFAATYPERVRALVNYGSLPRFVRGPNFPWMEPKHEHLAEHEAEAERWGSEESAREFLESQGLDVTPEAIQNRARRDRLMVSPGAFVQLARMNAEIDVRPILSTIRVPTLVLHRIEDPIPIEGARWTAEQIPGARFVELPGGPHMPYYGDWESVVDAIRDFVEPICLESARPYDSVLATVLFTDLVGSTRRRWSSATAVGASSSSSITPGFGPSSRTTEASSSTRPGTASSPASTARARDPLCLRRPRCRHRARARGARRVAHGRVRGDGREGRRGRSLDRSPRGGAGGSRRGSRLTDREGPRGRLRDRVPGSRRRRAQGRPRRVAAVRRRHGVTEPIRCWPTSATGFRADVC